jgi:carbon-monoxide dehydrogenase large subunit
MQVMGLVYPEPRRTMRTSQLGRPLLRREDERLLRGTAATVADLRLPGTVELAFVRSRSSHALVRSVDVSTARTVEGVVGAWAATDLGLPLVPAAGDGAADRPWAPLAVERVRFAGQSLAAVAGLDRYAAEDGCDAVRVELEPLAAVVDPGLALAPDAPQLWDSGNLVAEKEVGDPVEDVLADAAVVVNARYRQELVLHTSMEARAILVRPDDDGGITVWVSHQGQHLLRDALAEAFDLEPRLVRVVVPDTGGAFGAKSGTWSEYLVVTGAALELRRPVRWVEDRAEALLCAPRGRGQDQHVRLAADRDGRLLALDLDVLADVGGYPAQGAMVPLMTSLTACGPYALDRAHVRVRTVATTTAPTAAYRGAGRPEAAYQLERTMDTLARRLGLDPAELRRRNFLPPDAFPHTTPTGAHYDSGAYRAAFDLMLDRLGYDDLRAEQAARPGGGRLLGVGLACYVERSGAAAHSPEWGAVEVEPDGRVTAWTGSTSTGQAHETAFPQVVAEVLGVDPGLVRLVARDTREVREGHGTFGSRSMQVGGGALWRAAEALVRLARERLATAEGVDVAEVTYADGHLRVDGREVPLGEVAARTGPLRGEDVFTPPQAFPFGCYGAAVEVDPTTGHVEVRRLVAVDDYGVVVNPLVVQGQTYGSILQGLGQALYEDAGYPADGVPTRRTLLDYLIPTADEVPELVLEETETPNPHQPFGAKGAGEAGCIGVPPAVLNAVADALGLVDGDELQLPATPERVWALARR